MAIATSIQQLLNQLSGMGFGDTLNFSGLSNIGQHTIMNEMEDMFGLAEGFLTPGMFQTIDPVLLAGSMQKTYKPMIEANIAGLQSKLSQAMGGAAASQASGGFAGTGAYDKYAQQAKDVYGMGATEIFKDIGQQKQSSIQAIADIFQDWQTQASEIAAEQPID